MRRGCIADVTQSLLLGFAATHSVCESRHNLVFADDAPVNQCRAARAVAMRRTASRMLSSLVA